MSLEDQPANGPAVNPATVDRMLERGVALHRLHLEVLDLDAEAYGLLRRAGFSTVGQLECLTRNDLLLSIPHIREHLPRIWAAIEKLADAPLSTIEECYLEERYVEEVPLSPSRLTRDTATASSTRSGMLQMELLGNAIAIQPDILSQLCARDIEVDRLDIAALQLSTRGANALRRAGLRTLGQLAALAEDELLAGARNFGTKSLAELREATRALLTVSSNSLKAHYVSDECLAEARKEAQARLGNPGSASPRGPTSRPGRVSARNPDREHLALGPFLSPSDTQRLAQVCPELLHLPINCLDISIRLLRPLARMRVRTISQILQLPPPAFLKQWFIGPTALSELTAAIRSILTLQAGPWVERAVPSRLDCGNWGRHPAAIAVEPNLPLNQFIPGSGAYSRLLEAGFETCEELLGTTWETLIGLGLVKSQATELYDALADRMGVARLEDLIKQVVFEPEASAGAASGRRHATIPLALDTSDDGEPSSYSIPESAGAVDADHGEDAPSTIDDVPRRIQKLLAALPERRRNVVEMRYGLAGKEPKTLQDIAVALGVSRARVSQIVQQSRKRLRRENDRPRSPGFRQVSLVQQFVTMQIVALDGICRRSSLIAQMEKAGALGQISRDGFLDFVVDLSEGEINEIRTSRGELLTVASTEEVQRIAVLINENQREGASGGDAEVTSTVARRDPTANLDLVRAYISACKGAHDDIQSCRGRRRSGTRLAGIVAILQEAGQPLHYTELAERLRTRAGEQVDISDASVHVLLSNHREMFAVRGRGKYGLAGADDRGASDRTPRRRADAPRKRVGVADEVDRILQRAERELREDEIIAEVLTTWDVDANSIHAAIDTDREHRFYRVAGRVALRAWLNGGEGSEAIALPLEPRSGLVAGEQLKVLAERIEDLRSSGHLGIDDNGDAVVPEIEKVRRLDVRALRSRSD